MATGAVGGAPGATVICAPGLLVDRVTPRLVMDNEPPNRKLAVVAPVVLTAKVAMPPRMPIVALCVLITTSDFLLIAPPTNRKTPRPAFNDISPVFCWGS